MRPARWIAHRIACLALGWAGLTLPSGAAEIRLAWDPNAEKDLAGYGVYCRQDGPGPPYDFIGYWALSDLERRDAPRAVVDGLAPGRRFCWAVTAYNAAGQESDYSEPACGETAREPSPEAAPPADRDSPAAPRCAAPPPAVRAIDGAAADQPAAGPLPGAGGEVAPDEPPRADPAPAEWRGAKRWARLWERIRRLLADRTPWWRDWPAEKGAGR
jgi:hypothetical protein